MNILRKIPGAPLLAFALALVILPPQAEASCLSPSEARQVVAAGQAVPLSAALRRAGISGEVVRVSLCRRGAGYVYEVAVLEPDGRLRQVTIPAN
jgi:hypothetical protein